MEKSMREEEVFGATSPRERGKNILSLQRAGKASLNTFTLPSFLLGGGGLAKLCYPVPFNVYEKRTESEIK